MSAERTRIGSMEEKINFRLIFVGILSILLTAGLTIGVFYQTLYHQARDDLKLQAGTVAASYNAMGGGDLSRFEQDGLRVTLVTAQGEVLFESEKSTGEMENHLTRPEVRQALDTGRGEDTRQSDTMGYNTYYYAVRTEDGNVLRLARQVSTVSAVFSSALPAIVAVTLLILVLSVVLSVFLTKRLVRPIETMVSRLDDPDLQAPYQELRPFAEELRLQQGKKREMEAMRREFTANVSHELKTPLTTILGLSEMMENGMAREEDVREFSGKIHRESERLLALISDILKLSQLDEPEQTQVCASVDLLEVAQDSVRRLELQAKQAQVTLSVDGAFCPVRGDPRLLEELCYNLVDNSIRYNRPGGKVFVTALRENDAPVLSVKDSGIGIPEEHRERIFERFYRVDKSHSKETGGTGLGLAIVKHIALQHQAAIQVHSEENVGTEIRVVFPNP